MSSAAGTSSFLDKAIESLAGAESELARRRFNNAANRAYYACFQAAVHVLVKKAVRHPKTGRWSHVLVQAEFANLVKRQKLFPSHLRDVLSQQLLVRVRADYRVSPIPEIQAYRSVRHAREFVSAIQERGETL